MSRTKRAPFALSKTGLALRSPLPRRIHRFKIGKCQSLVLGGLYLAARPPLEVSDSTILLLVALAHREFVSLFFMTTFSLFARTRLCTTSFNILRAPCRTISSCSAPCWRCPIRPCLSCASRVSPSLFFYHDFFSLRKNTFVYHLISSPACALPRHIQPMRSAALYRALEHVGTCALAYALTDDRRNIDSYLYIYIFLYIYISTYYFFIMQCAGAPSAPPAP
jgi:hypothetical protein